jgi:hypothetical protein
MFELIKTGNRNVINLDVRKLKEKIILGEHHSVQFNLNGRSLSHLFRLRYNTSNGPYVLVKQDSYVFTLLTSKIPHNNYTGHSIVELSIIDNYYEKT